MTAPPQRKVAAFVTRDHHGQRQLLVFWHPPSGIQIPAGTVEAGESFREAADRETREESGLEDVAYIARLGRRTVEATSAQGFLIESLPLRTSPDGPVTAWRLPRAMIEIVDRADGWLRVVYAEHDVDAPPDRPLMIARLEGWLPEASVADRQQREFFHYHCSRPTPESWSHQAEPEHRFELRWHSLDPAPELISGQAEWLAAFRDQLRGP